MRNSRIGWSIGIGVALLLGLVLLLWLRADARTNKVALADAPKPVGTERARAGTFRPKRTYVGTLQPWALARVGPQYVSAYVGTVLVRPGAVVKRGDVLATLDCRNSSAATREIAARAKALEERRNALASETARMKQMIDGGFASENDVEQLTAKTAAQSAEVEGLYASLAAKGLEVDDCVLRAPFAGEIADRLVDPGAYVRPGNPVVAVIDRSTVRVVGEAPEGDFDVVAPGTAVALETLSTGAKLAAKISRRAPAADEATRTVHFEIDVPNANRALPVGTTAVISIDYGESKPATTVSLRAATVRGEKATLFVVEGGVAKRTVLPTVGEAGGTLFVDPRLPAGAAVVVEGRALLDDNDKVAAKDIAP
jgi:RND family efflux transporter MFP subunit